MSAFDIALLDTVRLVEASPVASYFEAATLIRDLKGRIRLMIEFHQNQDGTDNIPQNWGTEKSTLENNLQNTLGFYWGKQIWRKNDRRDRPFQAMVDAITTHRKKWLPNSSSRAFDWFKLERHFSKSSWQPSTISLPWPLESSDPAIISFYSFKGGMGRTTTTAAVALLLAKHNKRVLVLDLDLEAPGVGSLLLEGITPPDEGIVDYLLQVVLQGRPPALSPFVAIQNDSRLIDSGPPIRLMTAGQLNGNFLEKMARLDFENFVNSNQNPLRELLNQAHDEYDLDFILIDLRSGLHDLGGLSLNGLSHLDILFGQDTEQSWAGLQLVLELLGQSVPRHEVLFVHARDPRNSSNPAETHQRFLSKSYSLFQDHYYSSDEDVPHIEDKNAPYGLSIPEDPRFIGFSSLSPIVPFLTDPHGSYADLVRMIGGYLEKDTI